MKNSIKLGKFSLLNVTNPWYFQESFRKQEITEDLQQVYNSSIGIPAKSCFGGLTEGLVFDIFLLDMYNKSVQNCLCTEPNDSLKCSMSFVVAVEKSIKRHVSYDLQDDWLQFKVKVEPAFLCAISNEANMGFHCGRPILHQSNFLSPSLR